MQYRVGTGEIGTLALSGTVRSLLRCSSSPLPRQDSMSLERADLLRSSRCLRDFPIAERESEQSELRAGRESSCCYLVVHHHTHQTRVTTNTTPRYYPVPIYPPGCCRWKNPPRPDRFSVLSVSPTLDKDSIQHSSSHRSQCVSANQTRHVGAGGSRDWLTLLDPQVGPARKDV